MTITISSDDPRSIKALEIAAGAGQWLKCRTADGRKVYGVPSQAKGNAAYHLADCQSCTCQDAQRHQGQACKHVLAVRLHCELAKAHQPKPRAPRVATVVASEPDDAFLARFARL